MLRDLNISINSFSKEEYKVVKKRLTDGKAAGSNGTPLDISNYGILDDLILHYANSVLNNSLKSKNWCISYLKPLHESG